MGAEALFFGGVIGLIGAATRDSGGDDRSGDSPNVQAVIEQKQAIDKLEEESKKSQKELEDEKEKIRKEEELAAQKRKKEEKEKEIQKQEKIKNANEFYQKEKDHYFIKKLNEIKNNFNQNNFCLNQVTKLEPFINGQIPKVLSSLESELKSKIKE